MEWIIGVACAIAAWAALRLMGGERQRLIDELRARQAETENPSKSHGSPRGA